MSANIGAEPRRPAERLLGLLYDAGWAVVTLAAQPLAGRGRWREKCGAYDSHANRPRCWIHACSVGEVHVARRAMAALRTRRPDLGFTLSTITPEGYRAAQAVIATGTDEAVFFPFDSRRAMRRAFDRIDPAFVMLTEVELWPNHLREASARGLPVFVINGRLTASDEKNYRRAGRFMRSVFAIPDLVCARGPEEAARFTRLGARRVVVAGDMKYETIIPGAPTGALRSGHLLLGASTHPGEEEILLRIVQRLRPRFPHLRLVLVPRHPRRAPALARLARRRGFHALVSSQHEPGADVIVVGEVGHLASWYAQATVCFVGKSLTTRGGQNFLEAAACGCPVVVGPHLGNFAEAAETFRRAGAMVQVPDAGGLQDALARLLADPAECQRLREQAQSIVGSHRGIAQRVADRILDHLGAAL